MGDAETSTPRTPTGNNEAEDARLGRIVDDFLLHRSRGESITERELLERHSDIAHELREMLVAVGSLRPSLEMIDRLIRLGTLRRSDDSAYRAELDSYKIIDHLGRGGVGIVFEAFDESLGRKVAIKILRPELADDPVVVARMVREAKAAAILQHPNIVTVHAVGRDGGVPFIVMEYVRGLTLAQVIRDHGPLSNPASERILRELLMGLAVAHEQGLVHRDIKSSNILLDGWPVAGNGGGCEGQGDDRLQEAEPGNAVSSSSGEPGLGPMPETPFVKIADFGLAHSPSSRTTLTAAGCVLGTPSYMSPEQARGERGSDHRSDLYSAGVVLYEMLTGSVPFKAETATGAVQQILNVPPADPRETNATADPRLCALALRLMAKSPDDRLPSASNALEALASDARIRPRSPRLLRQRFVFFACSMIILIAIVGLVFTFTRAGQEPRPLRPKIDTSFARRILVERSFERGYEEFYTFPDRVKSIGGARELDLDGKGMQGVLVGLGDRVDHPNLFLFNGSAEFLWSIELSNHPQRPHWPGSDQPDLWACDVLEPAELNGFLGDEVVVVAHHMKDYPTRISVLNPRSQSILGTLWHWGHIKHVLVYPNFFQGNRPAIIAWGYNHKLDGFGDNRLDDPPKLTDWEDVWVIMVIDPISLQRQGHGLAPPISSRINIPAAAIHAYAFVGLAVGQGRGSKEDVYIDRVQIHRRAPESNSEQDFGFRVEIVEPKTGGSAALYVDRNLLLDSVSLADPERGRTSEAYWRQFWHPVRVNP